MHLSSSEILWGFLFVLVLIKKKIRVKDNSAIVETGVKH